MVQEPLTTRFLAWADRRHFVSVRALTMYVTLYLTTWSMWWAGSYASSLAHVDVAAGAIIAAVTAPVTALQGFVFKWYMQGKDGTP